MAGHLGHGERLRGPLAVDGAGRQIVRDYLARYNPTANGATAGSLSRNFVTGSSQYLSGSFTMPAYPYSIACWAYPTASAAGNIAFTVANSGANNNYLYLGAGSGGNANTVELGVQNTTNFTIHSSTTFTYSTWNHFAATFTNATSRSVFLNGGGKVTDTNSCTPAPNTVGVGGFVGATPSSYWDGMLMECAIWSVALTDAEVALLSSTSQMGGAGVPPAGLIRPDALVGYWPCFGNGSTELDQSGGGKTLTNHSTTQGTSRARVYYPSWLYWSSGS